MRTLLLLLLVTVAMCCGCATRSRPDGPGNIGEQREEWRFNLKTGRWEQR